MIINPDGSRQPTVTADGIYGFFGEYRFLSNFHECNISYDGVTYKSSEALYMALKTTDSNLRQHIASLNPSAAKKFGRTIQLRPHWDDVKSIAMTVAVSNKFYQNTALAAALLETGDKYLEETNNWGDTYWGVCDGKGINMLGKVLMYIREELRNDI